MGEPETFSRFYVEEHERLLREEHAEEVAAMREEFETRLGRLQEKWRTAPPGPERPKAIHPEDLTSLPRAEYREVRQAIKAGKVAITEDAPRGVWLKPVLRLKSSEFSAMPREERAKLRPLRRQGRIEIVPD